VADHTPHLPGTASRRVEDKKHSRTRSQLRGREDQELSLTAVDVDRYALDCPGRWLGPGRVQEIAYESSEDEPEDGQDEYQLVSGHERFRTGRGPVTAAAGLLPRTFSIATGTLCDYRRPGTHDTPTLTPHTPGKSFARSNKRGMAWVVA
jgi:hypothetical protein